MIKILQIKKKLNLKGVLNNPLIKIYLQLKVKFKKRMVLFVKLVLKMVVIK